MGVVGVSSYMYDHFAIFVQMNARVTMLFHLSSIFDIIGTLSIQDWGGLELT